MLPQSGYQYIYQQIFAYVTQFIQAVITSIPMSSGAANQKPIILESLIKFLAKSPGREKTLRLTQYFMKFLVTKYQEEYQVLVSKRNEIRQKQATAARTMDAVGMGRKLLRFGPSIITIQNLVLNLQKLVSGKSKEPEIILALKALSNLFIGMFFICDHYVWLYRMGLISNLTLKTKMQYWSVMGFFLDCVTNTVKNVILVSNQKNVLQNKALLIDFARVLCDLVVSYSLMKPGTVNGKVTGLLGTTTSLIGIYQMWG